MPPAGQRGTPSPMDNAMTNDSAAPWNLNVRGDEVPRLINTDAPILRTEAGPGTGKTFGLARRVVRLLHPKGRAANGSDVLVVAFNRVIAKDLRENIDCELNNSGVAERPEIHTVHALCLRMIGDDTRLLLPHERDAMLYDVLNAHHAIRDEYKIHMAEVDVPAGQRTILDYFPKPVAKVRKRVVSQFEI